MSSPNASDHRNLLDDIEATPVPGIDGRYVVDLTADWNVLYTFGGVSLAVALAAVRRHLARPDLEFVSSQATYIAPISPGRINISVEVLRSGRRGAQATCRMWCEDGGEPRADLIVDVVLGSPEPTMAPFIRSLFPEDAGSPDTSVPRAELDRAGFLDIPFHRQTEWRLAAGGYGPDRLKGDDARSVSWFRLHGSPIREDGAWDPVALAVPGDILGPAVAAAIGPDSRYFVVTMQLGLQWFAPLTTEWVCQVTTAIRSANGFVTGVSELWSERGELVAFATQNAMLRPFERVQSDGLAGSESQG